MQRNKKEAAEYLEISVKALDRYIGKKRIGLIYVKGAHGNEVRFEQDELDRFKLELADRTKPMLVPALVKSTFGAELTANNSSLPTLPSTEIAAGHVGSMGSVINLEKVEKFFTSLSNLVEQIKIQNEKTDHTEKLIKSVNTIVETINKEHQQIVYPLSDRLTLTIEEAAGVSGFPPGAIKKAIKESTLKSVKVGRSRRVRREDLEAWVEGL